MNSILKVEVPIDGMDCAECTMHVKKAISTVPGVESVVVSLTTEKAFIEFHPERVELSEIHSAVESAGYSIPDKPREDGSAPKARNFSRSILTLLAIVFGAVLFVVVVGEWLGLFSALTYQIPWYVGWVLVLVAGYPVFRKVFLAAIRGQVISHTLMTLGVIAALVVGEWATAVVVVFFMRVGDYVESFTTERARQAVVDLAALAPQKARVLRQGGEVDVAIEHVAVNEVVIVRPGEVIPVDGQVISGSALVNQATITGEAMPIDAGPGAHLYAASSVSGGRLSIRATRIGADTTFGQVIKLVEEAEIHRAEVQRIADKFSVYYLPIVLGIAAITFLIRRDPMATAAVLVVACSCAFALATPIAMLASIGAGARHGLMIKGGKYLELLDKADTVLIDKTGTLTFGQPFIGDIHILCDHIPELNLTGINIDRTSILRLAASVERYSEHPLADAVVRAAHEEGVKLVEPSEFESIPGMGVSALIEGMRISVGNRRMFMEQLNRHPDMSAFIEEVITGGQSALIVGVDDEPVALMEAIDRLRPEVPESIQSLHKIGIKHIELLTGDHEHSAQKLVEEISTYPGMAEPLKYRAELLPQDKIEIVKSYQAEGHCVVMVGDGVNDAPALAQADVGVAMGVLGSDVAIEAAHIALMRDDWLLVPQVFTIAKRTLRVVRTNIAFTAVYNIVGLTLAAFGLLPPVFAAAAQSIPDLGILANSSRLLRQK